MHTLLELYPFNPAPAEPELQAGEPGDREANAVNAAALNHYAVEYAAWKAGREVAARTRAEQLRLQFGLAANPNWYYWRGYICFTTPEAVFVDNDDDDDDDGWGD